MDTSLPSPDDVAAPGEQAVARGDSYAAAPRSVVVLEAGQEGGTLLG